MSLLFLWVSQQASAQHYRHQLYSEEDGLMSNEVMGAVQAPDGTMWFATLKGVSQYNGLSFRNFDHERYQLLEDEFVVIKCTPDGVIWLAAYYDGQFQVKYWKDDQWHLLALPMAIKHDPFSFFDIFQDKDQFKCVLGNTVLYQLTLDRDRYQVKDYRQCSAPKDESYLAVAYSPSGDLWFSHQDGLYHERDTTAHKLLDTYLKPQEYVYQIAFQSSDPRPYLLTNGGVYQMENGQRLIYKVFENFEQVTSYNSYNHLGFMGKDKAYFSLSSPIYELASGRVSPINYSHAASTSWPTQIITDQEHHIWMTSSRGVIKLWQVPFEAYNYASGLIEDEVSAILQLQSGEMLLGSNTGYNYLSKDGLKVTPFPAISLGQNRHRVMGLLQHEDGRVFNCASQKGLGIWNGKGTPKFEWKQIDSKSPRAIWSVFQWKNEVYAIYDHEIYLVDSQDNGLSLSATNDQLMRKVAVINDTAFALGHTIKIFDGRDLHPYLKDAPNRKAIIYDLCDWKGIRLVATRRGLKYVSGDTLVDFRVQGQKIDGSVFALLSDTRDNLWVGTSNGVILIEGGEMQIFQRGNGLIGNDINRGALIEDDQGRIWIGTDKGVSVFDYRHYHGSAPSPQLSFTKILTNAGRLLNPDFAQSLSTSENAIEFDFVGITFINEKSLSYRYRLNGYDQEWQYINKNEYPHARYTNLPPGTYSFEVQVRRVKKKWSPSLSTACITIPQPFIGSTYFWVSVMVAVAGVGLWIGLFLQSRKNERLLIKKVREKTRQYRESEAKVRKQNQEVLKLNEGLDRFTYSVSHDLKSPLNSIDGLVHLIQSAHSDEEKSQYLALIKSSSDKLKAYIGDLHAYSRSNSKSLEITKLHLAETVNYLVDTQRYAVEGFQFEVITEGDPYFETDKYQFGMILTNLISNAVKYRNKYHDTPYVKVLLQNGTDELVIKVEDNGLGIAADQISEIFDMFSKNIHKVQGSSGLGLYIVKKAVERLGGQISVESKVNIGSIFTIKLPKSQNAPA